MGPKIPEQGSKTSTVPVVWAKFGIFSVRSKWFPVANADHGRNLVISLWPGDKATNIGVAAQRLVPPQTFPSVKIRWKTSCFDFLGSKRHPPYWLFSKGQNINTEYYSFLLVQLKDILKEKRSGKVTKVTNNAPTHRTLTTQKKFVYLGFQSFDHTPYSSDLAPPDYHLFPGLK